MKTVAVQVESDHLERLASATPIRSICELIWNGLDADATVVRLNLHYNPLAGLDSLVISDNGIGLPYAEATAAFERLGGSWKRMPIAPNVDDFSMGGLAREDLALSRGLEVNSCPRCANVLCSRLKAQVTHG